MPLPTPNSGESQEHFMGRCMSNPTMMREYPNQKQRAAICFDQFRSRKMTLSKEEIGMLDATIVGLKRFHDQVGKARGEVWPSHKVIEVIKQRIRKLLAGLKKK